jgi:hypothetical protein
MSSVNLSARLPYSEEVPLTSFFNAIEHDSVEDLREMPISDVNVNHPNGTPPLHQAVQHSSVEACRWLLQNGIRLEEKWIDRSPLDSLVRHFGVTREVKPKKLQIFRLLLEAGADTNGSFTDLWKQRHVTREIIQTTPELQRVLEEISDQIANQVYDRIPRESHLTRLVGKYLDRIPSSSWPTSQQPPSTDL